MSNLGTASISARILVRHLLACRCIVFGSLTEKFYLSIIFFRQTGKQARLKVDVLYSTVYGPSLFTIATNLDGGGLVRVSMVMIIVYCMFTR